ncbi:MAG: hypothetical protein KDC85_13180 [Saprospiraceae bacterium]|nr:hypothetical protein [Saprospiraceae bacterium]MCB9325512.1 hypothetical protein [Lewinellaceae bacterium]
MYKSLFILSALLLLGITLNAQDASRDILMAFKQKMEKVEKYTVDARIKVEVDFINIKERKAKVTYTAPDKFDFKAEGFTLLPKKGMEMEYLNMMNEGFTSILVKEEKVRGINTSLIKVIPDNSDGDIVLAEMWIDPKTSVMHQMRTFSKDSGTYTINFFFRDNPYDLPDKIEVTFDVKNKKLPVSITGDFESLGKETDKGPTEGKVTIQYANYLVTGK